MTPLAYPALFVLGWVLTGAFAVAVLDKIDGEGPHDKEDYFWASLLWPILLAYLVAAYSAQFFHTLKVRIAKDLVLTHRQEQLYLRSEPRIRYAAPYAFCHHCAAQNPLDQMNCQTCQQPLNHLTTLTH